VLEQKDADSFTLTAILDEGGIFGHELEAYDPATGQGIAPCTYATRLRCVLYTLERLQFDRMVNMNETSLLRQANLLQHRLSAPVAGAASAAGPGMGALTGPERLLESICIVGLPLSAITAKTIGSRHTGKVLQVYPRDSPVDQMGVASFCFARGIQLSPATSEEISEVLSAHGGGGAKTGADMEQFIFTISGSEQAGLGCMLYGTCIQAHTLVELQGLTYRVPRCYCIVSRLPLLFPFFDLLRHVIDQEHLQVPHR
jgi:hypothetical protein